MAWSAILTAFLSTQQQSSPGPPARRKLSLLGTETPGFQNSARQPSHTPERFRSRFVTAPCPAPTAPVGKSIVINRERHLGVFAERLQLWRLGRTCQYELPFIPMEPDRYDPGRTVRPDITSCSTGIRVFIPTLPC